MHKLWHINLTIVYITRIICNKILETACSSTLQIDINQCDSYCIPPTCSGVTYHRSCAMCALGDGLVFINMALCGSPTPHEEMSLGLLI